MRKACFFLLLSVFLTTGFGQQLVRNGDFEDSLNYWTLEVNNNQGSYSVKCDTVYQPDPDYEVRVYKSMRYSALLKQTVDLPSTNVQFSASAKLIATKGSSASYYAYAALTLQYRNAADSVLGNTMIVKKIGNYNPVSDSGRHVINVTSSAWEDYSFLLADELESLPGINPADVARVTIYLQAYGNGSSG